MENLAIGSGSLTARIKYDGAELCSLIDAQGRELMWQGAAWPRHAPVLFPIVGKLAGDTLHHDGRDYRLTQHGFARDRRFTAIASSETQATFQLVDDAETRMKFPFAFRLELNFRVDGTMLQVEYALSNPGGTVLPASLGAHPAFCWPLPGAPSKAGHTLDFEVDEPEPIRRLTGGLIDPNGFTSPITGRHLPLDDSLFEADAIVMDAVRSTSVVYKGPGAPALTLRWQGFRELGLWMKPGAEFLCIEPWYGTASPLGFDGPFIEKPGLILIPPGVTRHFSWSVSVATP